MLMWNQCFKVLKLIKKNFKKILDHGHRQLFSFNLNEAQGGTFLKNDDNYEVGCLAYASQVLGGLRLSSISIKTEALTKAIKQCVLIT